MVMQRAALNLSPNHWGMVSWDVFKAHCTQAVLDLLEARRIKPVYVPGNCTSLASPNDHPEFNKNVKDLNKDKFMHFYAGKVEESLANGDQEVFIQFPAAEMKPLHAQWTAESLAFLATQEQWMENAFRGVGMWDIFQGRFVPDPLLRNEFWQPNVATPEEAAQDELDSDSEDEFVENSSDESDPDDTVDQDDGVDYNFDDEVTDDGHNTPTASTQNHESETDSEEEAPSQRTVREDDELFKKAMKKNLLGVVNSEQTILLNKLHHKLPCLFHAHLPEPQELQEMLELLKKKKKKIYNEQWQSL